MFAVWTLKFGVIVWFSFGNVQVFTLLKFIMFQILMCEISAKKDEGMTESPVETLEQAIVLHLFWTEGLTSFWHIERCTEFIASKGDDMTTTIRTFTETEAW